MSNLCERVVTFKEQVDIEAISDRLNDKLYNYIHFEYMRLFPGQIMSDQDFEAFKNLILEELK